MGVKVNSASQWLSGTLSNPPSETQWRLITAHVNLSSSVSEQHAVNLYSTDETRSARLRFGQLSSKSHPNFVVNNGGGPRAQNQNTDYLTLDEWYAVAVLVGPNNGASNAVLKTYLDGVALKRTNGVAYATVENTDLDKIMIGQKFEWGAAQYLRGWVADVAVWTPADEDEADDIAAEAATMAASDVTAGSPIWYAPLYDDGSVSVGGSVLAAQPSPATPPTYSTTDHPDFDGTAPDAPTIGSVTAVTHKAARINWTDNSSDETGFAVQYGVSVSGTVSSWSAAANSPAAANATYLDITSLTPETDYKARVRAFNASGESAWVETAEFTTGSAPAAVKGVRVTLGDGTTPAASVTGLSVSWWDLGYPSGVPDFEDDGLSTDNAGLLEIDIDSATSLNLDDVGYVAVYKLGAEPEDDLIAAGRTAVVDVA